ncbi:hypothetical protein CDAR_409491 [Caerostris darwini]|uniref:Uncharacterized protein n=1 Tax=Caerostris darwini TaxID=1538125 RepID=A0AAV4S5B1_9ARAC|nr:hypothetical protein CDAR_409491 [Caerostris darwini]
MTNAAATRRGKKERNGSKKGGFECFFRAKVAGDIPGGLKSEDGYRQAIKREGVTTHADCNRRSQHRLNMLPVQEKRCRHIPVLHSHIEIRIETASGFPVP